MRMSRAPMVQVRVGNIFILCSFRTLSVRCHRVANFFGESFALFARVCASLATTWHVLQDVSSVFVNSIMDVFSTLIILQCKEFCNMKIYDRTKNKYKCWSLIKSLILKKRSVNDVGIISCLRQYFLKSPDPWIWKKIVLLKVSKDH